MEDDSTDRNQALQMLLCAQAASALRIVAQAGTPPDPRLMSAVEAKRDYLRGHISIDELNSFRIAAEDARLAARALLNLTSKALPKSTGMVTSKELKLANALCFAAEAAICATSTEQGPDIDDPELEKMLEQFLLTGKLKPIITVEVFDDDSLPVPRT